MINAFAIEDERTALTQLKTALEMVPDITLLGEFGNIPEALVHLRKQGKVDVVFCDIELPGMSGLEAIELLKKHCHMLVFVTGHGQYAVQAYRQWVNGYIVKPVTAADLQQLVEAFFGQRPEEVPMKLRLGKVYLYDSSQKQYLPTRPADIIKILHFKNNLDVYVAERETPVVVRFTVKEAMDVLEPLGLFLQLNPKTIVNMGMVTGATPRTVSINTEEYDVTPAFLERYEAFLATCQFGAGNKLK